MKKILKCILGVVVFTSYQLQAGLGEEMKIIEGNRELARFSSNSNSVSVNDFTGELTIKHRDFLIPGPNGLDIDVTREFSSYKRLGHNYLGNGGVAIGVNGWSIFTGSFKTNLITKYNNRYSNNICESGGSISISGEGTKSLVPVIINGKKALQSSDNWVSFNCDLTIGNQNGITVFSPEGKHYEFELVTWKDYLHEQGLVGRDTGGELTLYRFNDNGRDDLKYRDLSSANYRLKKITDKYNNFIEFEYTNFFHPEAMDRYAPKVTSIKRSDGVRVTINYSGSKKEIIDSIQYGSKQWKYEYDTCSKCTQDVYYEDRFKDNYSLKTVRGPDGKQIWKYDNAKKVKVKNNIRSYADVLMLTGVTDRYGLKHEFTYSANFTGWKGERYLRTKVFPGKEVVTSMKVSGNHMPTELTEYSYGFFKGDISNARDALNKINFDERTSRIVNTKVINNTRKIETEFNFGYKYRIGSVWLYWDESDYHAENWYGGSDTEYSVYYTTPYHGYPKEVRNYEKKGNSWKLLKRKTNTYIHQNFENLAMWNELRGGSVNTNSMPQNARVRLSNEETTVYESNGETKFTKSYSGFDNFGFYTHSEATDSSGSKKLDAKFEYYHDSNAWLIGLLTKQTVNNIDVVSMDYNDKGSIDSKSHYGKNTRYTYDRHGNVDSETQRADQDIVKTYSDFYLGLPKSVQYSDGSREEYSYDSFGNKTKFIDRKRHVTTYKYDNYGRLTYKAIPLGLPLEISYKPNIVTYKRGDVSEVVISYDSKGRKLIEAIVDLKKYKTCRSNRDVCLDENGRFSDDKPTFFKRYKYNAFGELIFESITTQKENITPPSSSVSDHLCSRFLAKHCNPKLGNSNSSRSNFGTYYTYDGLGRLILKAEVFEGTHSRSSYSYFSPNYDYPDVLQSGHSQNHSTSHGYLEKRENGLFVAKEFLSYEAGIYDDITLEIKNINPSKNIITFLSRHPLGHIESIQRGSLKRTYNYNDRLLITSVIDPEVGTTHFSYNELGQVSTKSISNTLDSTFSYDSNGRLKSKKTFNKLSNDTDTVSFEYDLNGNMTVANSKNSIIRMSYNKNNALTSESVTFDGNNYKLEYKYDELNYVNSIKYPDGYSRNMGNDVLGRVLYDDSFVNSAAYKNKNKLGLIKFKNGLYVQHKFSDNSLPKSFSYGNKINREYKFDVMKNLISTIDRIDGTSNLTNSYDGASRLISSKGKWGTLSYNYDDLDNLLTVNNDGKISNYQYNSNNRLIKYSDSSFTTNINYDNTGRVSGYKGKAIVRDSTGRIKQVTTKGKNKVMTYDALGNQVAFSGDQKCVFIHSKIDNRLMHQKCNNKGTNFIYLNGTLIGKN
ncbi:RHS repeat protein [Vibrio alginolyticus]|uniref:RHS repeat protein n=1 Tax=Vibrio alginolyticus TaxID=663 RepID=UPI00124DBEE1|nr:RHS repeat protein [Vibrio alginolyticus]KAB2116620.1 RHS repeat protein [Vibrio alginolyticus]